MLDKFNPGGIVEELEIKENVIKMKIKHGGILGFYVDGKPKAVKCDEETIKFEYDEKHNLLSFMTKSYSNQEITIERE